jgi:hypothetical protein
VIFSVFNYDNGRYRYYEGIAGTPATGFFRKARQPALNGGFVPEAFAVTLPAGARFVGEGAMPKGYIAEDPAQLASPPVPGEPSSSSPASSSWRTLAIVAAVAFIAGRMSRRAA